MQGYPLSDIARILNCSILNGKDDRIVENLLTDSRKLLFPTGTLFLALSSPLVDATTFIPDLYEKGVRSFAIDERSHPDISKMPEASFLLVPDRLNTLAALHLLARFHRHRFAYEVMAITGSYGKTIVKDWLCQLLDDDFILVASPQSCSCNSQVDVPLSVWQMSHTHELGIFEAGISQKGEMAKLQTIIDPSIGLLTCIGEAHAAGFSNRSEKIREKLQLFSTAKYFIYGNDDQLLDREIRDFLININPGLSCLTWGTNTADILIKSTERKSHITYISFLFRNQSYQYEIPFTDEASVSNSISCVAAMIQMGRRPEDFLEKMRRLKPVEMRMELVKGIHNCSIINDSYNSNDLSSLSIAIDFLNQQQQHQKKTVILSDLAETATDITPLYSKIAAMLEQKSVSKLIGIGEKMIAAAGCFAFLKESYFFPSTDAFLHQLHGIDFHNETILIKGGRSFRFEKIAHAFQLKMHETVLEINLHALRHNLKYYRSVLNPSVKMMVMVKAFSYGSGSFEVANLLQHAGADYLAVAYADEGAELRKAGIHLPIMVMNPDSCFHQIIHHQLEPEIFSLSMLQSFRQFLHEEGIKLYPVHLELDTGMHRLGFQSDQMDALCSLIISSEEIEIRSVFSHLAGSDESMHDAFTFEQADLFEKMTHHISKKTGKTFMRHLSNSGAIKRHPSLQFDMVRLGIGLYGADAPAFAEGLLQNVSTLKTTISQIKTVRKGESIGYSRKAVSKVDSVIAIVRIGYADGYPRSLSNGKGKMLVNGSYAPVIGNICMDMTMLDITGLHASEGDEVIVFGKDLLVNTLAEWADTIPYEILTGVSPRVRRIYFEE